jgi:hypothetical protein
LRFLAWDGILCDMGKHTHIELTSEERTELEKLIRTGNAPARTHTRARILLLSDRSQGQKRTDQEVADAVCVQKHGAMCDDVFFRVDCRRAADKAGRVRHKVHRGSRSQVGLSLSEPPEGAARWTLRLLADKMVELHYVDSMSHVTVGEILKKNEIKPWRVKSWCIGKPSGTYVAKMEDVLDVYQRPYAPTRPVVCLDEASKELHDLPRGSLPVEQGQPRRQDYEYERHGVANLFLMIEPLRGWRKVRVTERRTRCDFAEQLRLLSDEDYPQAERIVLVVDNLNTHGPGSLYEAFEPEEAHRLAARFEWHYTPEHGSWLNIAECELSVLQRQCLDRPIPDMSTLKREVSAWEERRNKACSKVIWHFTTADARIKLRRLYPVVKEQNLT